MSKSAVGSMSEWSGVLKDFFRQIHDGSHTLEAVKAFNEHHSHALEMIKAFNEHRNLFVGQDILMILSDQQTFYHNFFGLDPDFSQVRIPERKPGFDRLIVVAQGLTPNQAFDACQHNFKCWRHTEDLDAVTNGLNERESTQHYAIWVRDRTEADEELKNLSANQIKTQGMATETLLERLIHELKYWDETGGHLDIANITLCAGSRHSDGYVPGADWDGDGLYVDWYLPDGSNDRLRAREVVS